MSAEIHTLEDIAAWLALRANDQRGTYRMPQSAKLSDEFAATIRDAVSKLEAHKRDTERLDWLEAHPFMAYRQRDPEGPLEKHFTVVNEDAKPRTGMVAKTIRQAIDAAIEAEKKKENK